MDPDSIEKLVQAAPAIAKGVGAVAAAVPFTAIVKRMLGPAADELAEMWRDQVRMYRYERQLKCVEKAERMAQEAGFTPKAVPPKILFPLLEGVSYEEDENLHDMWSALLANASSPENSAKVRPSFISTLRQMAADEARMLNAFFSERTGKPGVAFNRPFDFGELVHIHSLDRPPDQSDPLEFHACIQSLHAEQLVEQIYNPDHTGFLVHSYALTMRGMAFVYSCHPPEPKQNG